MKILITGSAGFIGFHVSKLFLKKGHSVIGVDNLNRYYDVKLKKARNRILLNYKKYAWHPHLGRGNAPGSSGPQGA